MVSDTATKKRRPLRVLISAGPTREPVDPVRYLSNYSTGHMGAQLARHALARGHRVTVVLGPSGEPFPEAARLIAVESAREMERALRREAPRADVIIMAAAVADFRPVHVRTSKIARHRTLTLVLTPTRDILGHLPRRQGQLIAGFAVETGRVVPRARRKLREKRLDLVLAQRATVTGAPFGRRAVDAWLLERGGKAARLGRVSKRRVARALLDKLEGLWYGQRE